MAFRALRSFISRLALVSVLTVMLASTLAVGGPTTASAREFDCTMQMNIAWGFQALGNTMNDIGATGLGSFYNGKYQALADTFYDCYRAGG